jgi:hypothetical protein
VRALYCFLIFSLLCLAPFLAISGRVGEKKKSSPRALHHQKSSHAQAPPTTTGKCCTAGTRRAAACKGATSQGHSRSAKLSP